MVFLYALVIAVSQSYLIAAHSWLACTDYDGSESVYDPQRCSGYARCGLPTKETLFGVDTGFESRGHTCQCSYDEAQSDYAEAPAAIYQAGQRVCLAYPSKNHVAAKTTNEDIPDEGVRIRRTECNEPATEDFTAHEYDHLNGKHENGVIDYKGFQNCPWFDQNNDKALCTMCFDLEKDLAPGLYGFSWEWQFNREEFYTTCWDAVVIAVSGNGTLSD